MADPVTGGTTNTSANHRVVAVPYPGRGHINPMLIFCKLMASKRQDITNIIIIVTEEWLGYINPENYIASRISFATIPNVLPSEVGRGSDLLGFFRAVQTDMEGPVENALDALGAPIELMVADSCLGWALHLARRRKLRMASFWTASAASFLVAYHYQLIMNISPETGEERIEFIPGIQSIRVSDLPSGFLTNKTLTSMMATKIITPATEAECIIFRSPNELEAAAIQALGNVLSTPTFAVGPAIPNLKTTQKPDVEPTYITWLGSQKKRSVLYISLGSFLSTSSAQMDELAAGLRDSGVPFLWVTRDPGCQVLGRKGMVVPWCDQMRVLCHPSTGGFFTHCGWNSVLETAFAGVPALTFPLGAEQPLNGKIVVEDWGIGWRVIKDGGNELVGRERVAALLNKFMDLNCSERKQLDRASRDLQERLLASVNEDGSTCGFDAFLTQMM